MYSYIIFSICSWISDLQDNPGEQALVNIVFSGVKFHLANWNLTPLCMLPLCSNLGSQSSIKELIILLKFKLLMSLLRFLLHSFFLEQTMDFPVLLNLSWGGGGGRGKKLSCF